MRGEAGELCGVEREKDLVRRRKGGEGVAVLGERRTDAVCHADGVRAAALVESVREEGIELDAEHASLRQKCAALLHDGEEMRHGALLREDDRLAEECAAFRSADVERIAEPRDGGEGQLVCTAAERVCEPRAVEEERNAVRAANGADDLKLVHRIERSVLRRMREVDHAGAHHMIAVRILMVGTQTALDRFCRELAVRVRQGEHLVTARLDRARLVHGDVPRIGGDHALVGVQQRGDDNAVRLCSAREEMNLCVRRTACLADLFPRRLRIWVKPVARRLLHIRIREPPQDFRVRALHIVRVKGQHLVHIIISLCSHTSEKAVEIQGNPEGIFLIKSHFLR